MGHRQPRTARRGRAADAAAAATLAVVASLSAAFEPSDPLSGVTRPFDGPAVLLVIAMTAPLAVRRSYPRAVAVLTTAIAAAAVVGGFPVGIGPFGAAFALHSLAYTTSNRTTIALGIPTGVVLLASQVASPGDLNPANVVGNGLFILVGLAAGALLRINNEQRSELVRRNRELTVAREAQVRSAVSDERLRIAREVHDAVGHALVAVTLHARAGQRRIERNPAGAGAALCEIEALAQHALQETRSAVTTFRKDARPPVVPRLSRQSVLGLIEAVRGTDLHVELDLQLDGAAVDADQERAAFRIIQESLTNVVKHAAPARAEVTVAADGQALRVEVTDHGGTTTAHADTGSGIHGMRERAERLGGSLTAGPTPTGWRVRALLPAQRDDAPTVVA